MGTGITLSGAILLGLGLLVNIPAAPADKPERPTPWLARGTVTDVNGKPISGAEIIAHCGRGTLLKTGSAISGPDGTYELRFGPGMLMPKPGGVQAATISVRKPGYFETNLYRQGDLVAAYEPPRGTNFWGNKRPDEVFLPGQVRRLDFVMQHAGSINGTVLDASGKPLANKRIGLTGNKLPPSSSVLQEKKTDAGGRFEFPDVPTGYRFKLYVDDGRSDWRKWPSVWVQLKQPAARKMVVQLRGDRLEVTDRE